LGCMVGCRFHVENSVLYFQQVKPCFHQGIPARPASRARAVVKDPHRPSATAKS
jgi:hypothetical protein